MHPFLCRRLRCLCHLLVVGPLLICYGLTPAVASERKPKIRTITAFVRIDSSQYRQQIGEAVTMLRQAKAAFEKGGYEVQTVRITTQPFTQFVSSRSAAEAVDFFKSMDDLSKRDSFMLNIGPLTVADSSDVAKVELLSQVLLNSVEGTARSVRWASAVAFIAALLSTIIFNVQVNLATGKWSPDNPPEDWKATRNRWEFFQGLRSWLLLLGFVLLCWAVTMR